MLGREADVQDVVDALFRALCDDRDIEAFANLWVGDSAITMWGSTEDERGVGIDEVLALGSDVTASERTFRFSWDERRAHELGDVAWVNASGTVDVDGVRKPYRLTAVLVRTADGWRWHTFNGSVPDPGTDPDGLSRH